MYRILNTCLPSKGLFGTRLLSAFCLGLALTLAGCAGGPDFPSAAEVQKALDAGRLDRAQLLMERVPASARIGSLERVATKVKDALSERIEQREELAQVGQKIAAVKENELLKQLRALKRRAADSALKLEIEEVMSRLPDTYREHRASLKQGRRPGLAAQLEQDLWKSEEDQDAGVGAEPETRSSGVMQLMAQVSQTGASGAGLPAANLAAKGATSVPADLVERTGQSTRAADPTDALGWRKLARREQAAGHLDPAHAAFLQAAEHELRRSMRDSDLAQATALEERSLLRAELAALHTENPGALQGVDQVSTAGLRIDGTETSWDDIDGRTWTRLTGDLQLSARAELGLIRERLLWGDEKFAFRELRRLRKANRIEDVDVTSVVAGARGEAPPPAGYVWHSKSYVSKSELDRLKDAEERARLSEVFTAVRPGRDLEASWAELSAVASEPELMVALRLRHERVVDRIVRYKPLESLEKVAEMRRALDLARESALELIFDEEEYFYPYRPPECPPEKAKDYPAVQRRVDELVGAVRGVWDEKVSVKIDERTAGLVSELLWLTKQSTDLDSTIAWPKAIPEAIGFLDLSNGPITLASFAWDEAEAAQLTYNRQVRSLNDRIWSDGLLVESEDLLEAQGSEQQQVQITNDYRLMFGRKAVAWNPRLQRAAQDHSGYMSDTGDFGHYETNPETKSPFDRMERRGYSKGRSENCYMGTGEAMAAHLGWVGSSGHHRNLLMLGHRELGSAVSGPYWTQNFGVGDEFTSELR